MDRAASTGFWFAQARRCRRRKGDEKELRRGWVHLKDVGVDGLGFKVDNGDTSEWILGFDDFTKKKEKFSLPLFATMWTIFFFFHEARA